MVTERDYFLSAEEGIEFGLIDELLVNAADSEAFCESKFRSVFATWYRGTCRGAANLAASPAPIASGFTAFDFLAALLLLRGGPTSVIRSLDRGS